MPGEFLLYLSRRFRWSLYALVGGLATCASVRAQHNPVASTAPAISSASTISTGPALGSLPVPASVSITTPTYAIEESTPTPAETEQESKRLSRLARILKIHAEGNRNIRERVILAQVKTRKNDLYDPDKLRKDDQAIYGLGNFED